MKSINVSALCMVVALVSFMGFVVENVWVLLVGLFQIAYEYNKVYINSNKYYVFYYGNTVYG